MSDAAPDASPDTAPITPEMVESHGLSESEYAKVLEILGRAPKGPWG